MIITNNLIDRSHIREENYLIAEKVSYWLSRFTFAFTIVKVFNETQSDRNYWNSFIRNDFFSFHVKDADYCPLSFSHFFIHSSLMMKVKLVSSLPLLDPFNTHENKDTFHCNHLIATSNLRANWAMSLLLLRS